MLGKVTKFFDGGEQRPAPGKFLQESMRKPPTIEVVADRKSYVFDWRPGYKVGDQVIVVEAVDGETYLIGKA